MPNCTLAPMRRLSAHRLFRTGRFSIPFAALLLASPWAAANPVLFVFRIGQRKYDDAAIANLIAESQKPDTQKPVFVFEDENGVTQGHVFCILQITQGDDSLADRKVLCIDDLCMDAKARGQNIVKQLYEYTRAFAENRQCHSVTLHAWHDNENALGFYRKLGIQPLKTLMEQRPD